MNNLRKEPPVYAISRALSARYFKPGIFSQRALGVASAYTAAPFRNKGIKAKKRKTSWKGNARLG